MSYFTSTLHALAPLFALILIGYCLKKWRILHVSNVPVMNGLVMNVTIPALIVHGLASAPSLPWFDTLPAVSAFIAEIVAMALAYGLGVAFRLPQRTVGMLMLISTFANTGFLGYPMVLALFKDQMPSAIILDQFGEAVPLIISALLIGPWLGGQESPEELTGTHLHRLRAHAVRVLKTLRTPLSYSIVIGIGLRIIPGGLAILWHAILLISGHHLDAIAARAIPWSAAMLAAPAVKTVCDVLMQILDYLAQGTIPIVLLALGVSLRPSSLKGDPRPVIIASVIKLLIVPLVAFVVAQKFGLHGDMLHQTVLQTAMPTAVMASVYSAQNDLDGDKAVGIVFITTVISAVSVPFLLGVLR